MVLSRTPINERNSYRLRQDGDGWAVSEEGPREERGLACGSVNFGVNVRVCATHLATEDATAVDQARAIADWTRARQRPILLAGDLNAVPDLANEHGTELPDHHEVLYAPAQGGQGPFYEAAWTPGSTPDSMGEPTHNEGKLDYVLGEAEFFEPETTSAVHGRGTCSSAPDGVCSDHEMVGAELTLRDGSGADPNIPPTDPLYVNAGPAVSGDEGDRLTLAGEVASRSGSATARWSYRPGAGTDPGARCSFADPGSPRTTLTCTDDGTYTATLTGDDGLRRISDSARVTVRNVAPRLRLTGPEAWQTYRVDDRVALRSTIVDPGSNDTTGVAVIDGGWIPGIPRPISSILGRLT